MHKDELAELVRIVHDLWEIGVTLKFELRLIFNSKDIGDGSEILVELFVDCIVIATSTTGLRPDTCNAVPRELDNVLNQNLIHRLNLFFKGFLALMIFL